MKKLNKLTAVLLSLALCLGMVAPAFAASLGDLQDAINGVEAPADSAPDPAVPQNGTQVEGQAEGTLGYGWNEATKDTESNGWDIWARIPLAKTAKPSATSNSRAT